jgi:Berberine and berberine like
LGIWRVGRRAANRRCSSPAVQPYSAGGYVNYIEQNTTAVRYFGANLAKLSTIRQKYDPGQLMFSGLSF